MGKKESVGQVIDLFFESMTSPSSSSFGSTFYAFR